MKKNTPYFVTAASAVVALISIASAVGSATRKKAAEAEVMALQEQIGRMQAYVPDQDPPITHVAAGTNELAALRAQLAALQARPAEPAERGQRQRESLEERLAKLKEGDPEAYAEMLKRREERQERQQQMRNSLAERTTNFMDMETSYMSEEELANHEQLLNNMAAIWELTAQFENSDERPDRETMRELSEIVRETQPLLEAARTSMFTQMGADMGYEAEDALEFASYIEEIISATTLQPPGRGGGGGRGR